MILLTYSQKIYKQKGFNKSRIFFLRSLLFPFKVTKWLIFIDNFYRKHGFICANTEIVSLPIRSYVCNQFSIAKRINILCQHYQIMENFFSNKAIKKILTPQNDQIIISSLIKKNGELCHLKIMMHGKFWKEGAMTIYLLDRENNVISTLTFTLYHDQDNQNAIFIGGLQGGSQINKEEIVSFTRSLGGLRPKHALIECCYAIADFFEVKKIIGISNQNHVFSYQKTFQKNYDNIWQEIGSKITADNNFLLPKNLAKRDFSEVPQKKRKEWLIKHNHLEKLNLDIKQFFNNLSLKSC